MRRFLAIPCLVILPFLLTGCGGEEKPQIACADLEKRTADYSKTLLEDAMKAGRAKASGDTKTVCQTSSAILANVRPMFQSASVCKSISIAVSSNKLIRSMEELRQESKCG